MTCEREDLEAIWRDLRAYITGDVTVLPDRPSLAPITPDPTDRPGCRAERPGSAWPFVAGAG